MKHNAENAQVMPFKAVNNCGQSWARSLASQEWSLKKKSAPELHREYLYTHFLLSLCDHGKPRGDDVNREPLFLASGSE